MSVGQKKNNEPIADEGRSTFGGKSHWRLTISKRSLDRELDASFLARTAAVVRNWRDILDQFDIQTSGLKSSNRTFSPTAWTLDANLDVPHSKLLSLLSSLLSGALTSKRSAFSRSFKTTCPSRRPAESITLGIGDCHRGVIERCVDVRDARVDIATDTFLFVASRLGHK